MSEIISSLVKIIESEAFQQELGDLSLYCSHVKQERYILGIISKCIWKSEESLLKPCLLEVKKKDLWLNGITLQAKHHYEYDIIIKLEKDKKSFKEERYVAELQDRENNKKSYTFVPGLSVVKDFQGKHRPNIFLWIVSCRIYTENYENETRNILKGLNETFTVYEKQTFSFRSKHNARSDELKKTIEEKAMDFLTNECTVDRAKIRPVWKYVENRYFKTEYLFLFCDLGEN
jgi:hypothetical protein